MHLYVLHGYIRMRIVMRPFILRNTNVVFKKLSVPLIKFYVTERKIKIFNKTTMMINKMLVNYK